MRRMQPRQKNGRWRRGIFQWLLAGFRRNVARNRKQWFEASCIAVLGSWGVVAVDLHPVAEAYYSIPEKHTFINPKFGQDELKFRDSVDHSSLRGTASEDTGETVSAVSAEPRESEEGGNPLSADAPTSSVEAKILKAWEGTGEGHIAVAVAKSESGLRPNAVGDIPLEYWHEGKKIGHSCGIFQIRVLPGRPDCETLKNEDKNIEFAKKLYDRSGFYPWSNWKNGRYLLFMDNT